MFNENEGPCPYVVNTNRSSQRANGAICCLVEMATKRTTSSFGDARLDKAFARLVDNLTSRWTLTLRKLAEDAAQANRFSRFINNKAVTPRQLLQEHWKRLQPDLKGRHLLAISDTTTLSFRPLAKREALGTVTDTSALEGFDIHPTVLVDADTKACLGPAGMTSYQRPRMTSEQDTEQRAQRRQQRNYLPFEQKERYKWWASPCEAVGNCSGAAQYTLVGDREADIFELMHRVRERGWHFLYRSRVNRVVEVRTDGSKLKLHDLIASQPVRHTYPVKLRSTAKRSAHTAELHVKFGEAAIQRSTAPANKHLPASLPIHYVEVGEDDRTVVGKERPIHWVLLTSHAVTSVEQALKVIGWYISRWDIEQIFRTMKVQGLELEKVRYEKFAGLCNVATLALIGAGMVMQLRRAFDERQEQSSQAVFSPVEQECVAKLSGRLSGKTDKLRNPHQVGTLAFGAWVVARLGGWSGYASAAPPGPITFIDGIAKLCLILEGYQMMREG